MQTVESQPVQPTLRVLRVDASARSEGSITRRLADRMVEGLAARVGGVSVARRDVAQGLPFVDADWVAANFTDPDARSATSWRAPMPWWRRSRRPTSG